MASLEHGGGKRTGAGAQCVQRCCEKFMKHSARVGMRFAELSSEAEQQMQKIMQQGGR